MMLEFETNSRLYVIYNNKTKKEKENIKNNLL